MARCCRSGRDGFDFAPRLIHEEFVRVGAVTSTQAVNLDSGSRKTVPFDRCRRAARSPSMVLTSTISTVPRELDLATCSKVTGFGHSASSSLARAHSPSKCSPSRATWCRTPAALIMLTALEVEDLEGTRGESEEGVRAGVASLRGLRARAPPGPSSRHHRYAPRDSRPSNRTHCMESSPPPLGTRGTPPPVET